MNLTRVSSAQEPLANVFEERAENLSQQELELWSATTPRDLALISKLKGPGSKLLSGPRGSGKSTLLRRAYFELLKEGNVLPAYINYSRALALEPLFHTHANALQLFRQWVLLKVVIGVAQALTEAKRASPPELIEQAEWGKSIVHSLEIGNVPEILQQPIAPSKLLEQLEVWAVGAGFKRCVLLMDDAAHAFSQDQQQQFFEIYRELRSRRVAAKAAVYPGITSYSPFFHVGHEAEVLEAWYRPEESEYLPTMRSIVDKRLPDRYKRILEGREELTDLLALASFGLPRGYLNMLGQVLGVDDEEVKTPSRRDAEKAVAEHAESVRRIFGGLTAKLPRFKHFVEVGTEFERAVVATIRTFNRGRQTSNKAVVVAIEEPIGNELDRILKFLEYAGMVRPIGTVSRGVKGVFQRYAVHYAVVISENALSLGRSYPLSDVISALSSRDAHAFVRGRGATFLGDDFEQRCTLDLPACASCGTPRIAADQRFCMNCGAELANVSVYEDLLKAPIEQLPLTATRITRIRQHSDIRTVQDILLDDELQKIRHVPYVGPIWAARIRTYAEEFVSV